MVLLLTIYRLILAGKMRQKKVVVCFATSRLAQHSVSYRHKLHEFPYPDCSNWHKKCLYHTQLKRALVLKEGDSAIPNCAKGSFKPGMYTQMCSLWLYSEKPINRPMS